MTATAAALAAFATQVGIVTVWAAKVGLALTIPVYLIRRTWHRVDPVRIADRLLRVVPEIKEFEEPGSPCGCVQCELDATLAWEAIAEAADIPQQRRAGDES